MAEEKKLFLLDAYALIFRAYYAFIRNPRITSKGFNTSAIFGFVNALEEIMRSQKPTHIAVVFDPHGGTFRSEKFPFYKANRDETPEDIKASDSWIKDIIRAYNIPILEADGFEADDVIGTLSKVAAEKGFTVYMMTPDKDYAQLVDDNIFIYKPGRQGKPAEILGVPEVREKYSIENPVQMIDILGMMGDAVDNIPGIPGVGEKTAIKLIAQFGSMEEMYERTDEIKGKLREKVEANRQQAFDSKWLARIILDVPVAFEPEKLVLESPDKAKLSELFQALEFRSISRRILGDEFTAQPTTGQGSLFASQSGEMQEQAAGSQSVVNTKHTYHLVDTADKRSDLIRQLSEQKTFAFDTETTGLDSLNTELVGMSFSWEPHIAYYVHCPVDQQETAEIAAEFKAVLENPDTEKIGHNIKFDMKVLGLYDVHVKGRIYDTMIAQYLSNSDAVKKLDRMAESYLGYQMVPIEDLIGKRGKNQKTMRDVSLDDLARYAAEDADITFQLKKYTDESVANVNGQKLLSEVELPLIHVLTDMERNGIKVDEEFLQNYSKELTKDQIEIRDKVFSLAGNEFNLDSPRQLGTILFEKLAIPYEGKKTKTGQYSTAEDVLSLLAEAHEIIPAILDYRELTKLKSTYIDALPALINPRTGRIHTTFNQTIAATGRLSSIGPNLQNIPIRTERGRATRKAFIPCDSDHVLLAADYSQVELRILAHITEDEGMLAAFTRGEDIHTTTASRVFGVSLDEVDREMRRKAKAVNFGLAYGQSAFGLSQTLTISRTEAKAIIDNYFEKFPGIRQYMEDTKVFAREHGYVETIMGRRRYLRDINSKNWTVRAQAERNAINSPIQGSAADLIKVAMINIHSDLKAQNFATKMLLQVHDELVFEVPKSELDTVSPLIEEGMKTAIPNLKVPVVVDVGVGGNWLEAH
jgi:DNA polymerase I